MNSDNGRMEETKSDEAAAPTSEEMEDLEAADPADAPDIAEKLADRLEAVLDRSEDEPPEGRSR